MDFASFVTGFVDGEGCFSVSFNKRARLKLGIEVRPSFSVAQHKRNRELLQRLQQFFKCGGIRFSKSDQNYIFEVRALNDLWLYVIPHFKRYPLQGIKRQDFDKFVKICRLMKQSKHLNLDYLRDIISMAYTMNESGKRRYKQAELLSILDKMKR